MALSTRIMTAAQDRKKALLAVCLCLLAISVTYRLLNPYRQERVARLAFPRAVSQAPKADPKGAEQVAEMSGRDVWVELFLHPPTHSGKVNKNVFQKQELASQAPPGSEGPAAISPEPLRSPEADKRLEVQEELSRFKSFGYMQGKDEKVLFLERGKDILMIREGDRIDEKYLVKSITEKHLIIRAESIGEDVRIDLGKF
jgi:hypothetical protein